MLCCLGLPCTLICSRSCFPCFGSMVQTSQHDMVLPPPPVPFSFSHQAGCHWNSTLKIPILWADEKEKGKSTALAKARESSTVRLPSTSAGAESRLTADSRRGREAAVTISDPGALLGGGPWKEGRGWESLQRCWYVKQKCRLGRGVEP